MSENDDITVEIRATHDSINGIMVQKSTRLIFGGMTLASDVFFTLNVKQNELLNFLYKEQRDYEVPLSKEEFPIDFTLNLAILDDLQLIGVLSPIHKDNNGNYNLVSKLNLIIPPVTKNDRKYLAHRYSSAYLINVVGLPRPSGYRGIKTLKEITLKLRYFEEKTDSGVTYRPKELPYNLIELIQDPETKKKYCQFNIDGYERFLELPQESQDRFLLHTRLELKNYNRIKEFKFLFKELKEKYDRFDLSLVDAARYSQSKYATLSEVTDPKLDELSNQAKSDQFKNALSDWKTRLDIVNLIKELLKKLIKAREKHSVTFNEHNLDHLEKLYATKDELTKKFNQELLQYVSHALREVMGSSQSHPYNTEEEVVQKAYYYYWEPINEKDQQAFTEIKRFYHLSEGRMSK